MMTLKEAISVWSYVYDDNVLVGMCRNPGSNQEFFFIGDIVKITPDENGFIRWITGRPGIGMIVEIHENRSGFFFTVQNEYGEISEAKGDQLMILHAQSLVPGLRAMFEATRQKEAVITP